MTEKIKKIVMIGPVYPYKSGIAHYTGLLCNALRKKYDVEMISFKMQYPKLLFRQEQKDYSSTLFKAENVKYWINTINPINHILSAVKIKHMQPDFVIMQWWHPYFAPCYWFLLSAMKKVPVFFVCHNVLPHKRFVMDRVLTKTILEKGKGYIVQSLTDEADLKSIMGECSCITAVHPTYDTFKHMNLSKKQAREALALGGDEKVLLFFGFVKEYKGLKHLLQAMPFLRKKYPDIRLLVVGEFDQNKEQYMQMIKELDVADNITIVDRFVPDEEVETYFAASDMLILPYESATQSGIVQMAYGFEKPVVVTEVGGLPDVVTDGVTGYVVPAQNPESIAEAVGRYYEEDREEVFIQNIRQEAKRFSWERMVEHIETLWSEMQ